MVRILLGTCSWADKSLIECGRFYPAGVKTAADRLRFYSSVFPTVEVDSTYYGLPTRAGSSLWVNRTPPGFKFHVKAFRLFTGHWAPANAFPPELRPVAQQAANPQGRVYLQDVPTSTVDRLWEAFENALLPLDSAGKLGVVLFQLAPWVTPSPRALNHILECKKRLPQYLLAVEFRNSLWLKNGQRERTLDFLREHRLVYLAVDEPQGFPSSVPPVAEVTDGVAYVRFHGRNKERWTVRGETSSDRFDYWYKDQELLEWAPRIQYLAERAQEVNLLFNTNRWDQGPQNARRMARLQMALGPELPLENMASILALPESSSYV